MAGWKVAAGLLLIAATLWGAIALGSFVYLDRMGFADEFEFPWNQLLVVLPYIVSDGWHGMETLRTWNSAFIGVMAMIAVLAIGVPVIVRVWWRMPAASLYGKTAWATRPMMQANGLPTSKRPF